MNNYPDGSPLGEAFTAILTRNDVRPVPAEEAPALIEAVATGDSPATVRVLHAMGGTLRKLRANFRRVPREEFDSAVCMALFEAARDFDFDATERHVGALAGLVFRRSVDALAASTSGPIPVPARTVRRFFAIERAAKDEAEAQGVLDHSYIAVRIAGEHGMSPECYLDVRNALASCYMYQLSATLEDSGEDAERMVEAAAAHFIDPDVTEGDTELAELALNAVSDREADVCYVAYGFGPDYCEQADYEPRPDAEVGARLGLSTSTAHRTRRRALAKMRDALLAD